MRHRFEVLVATIVMAGASWGCGSDDTMTAGAPATNAGGDAPAATAGSSGVSMVNGGTVATPPGTGGRSSVPTSGRSGGGPSTGGSTPVPAAGSAPATGGTGGVPPTTSGTGGAPPATGGTGGAPPATGGTGGPVGAPGSCGPETDIPAAMLGNMAMLAAWKPMHVENTGPTGASWVFYPEGFGKDGMKHPVFLWGPGAGTGPSNYKGYLDLLASHGIVVISQASSNSGKQALDWILAENMKQGSMWFGKLDPDRVARGGHSMGALLSMRESMDSRLKATILVCGGANGSGGANNITYPSLFLGATGEGGTTNFKADYAQVKGPSVFVTHKMSDHVACGRDNLAPWVAFLRWHLCGEEAKWKKEFMAGGTYCGGMWEACMMKMF